MRSSNPFTTSTCTITGQNTALLATTLDGCNGIPLSYRSSQLTVLLLLQSLYINGFIAVPSTIVATHLHPYHAYSNNNSSGDERAYSFRDSPWKGYNAFRAQTASDNPNKTHACTECMSCGGIRPYINGRQNEIQNLYLNKIN